MFKRRTVAVVRVHLEDVDTTFNVPVAGKLLTSHGTLTATVGKAGVVLPRGQKALEVSGVFMTRGTIRKRIRSWRGYKPGQIVEALKGKVFSVWKDDDGILRGLVTI